MSNTGVLDGNNVNQLHTAPNQAHGPQPGSSKRALEEAALSLEESPAAKRRRPQPDLSTLLPPPSNCEIQLRFQLCRFQGVYRVVRVPFTFTFAHLYRLILLLFGWSGYHGHQAEVLTHVEKYASPGRKGEVKKHRYWKVPPRPARGEEGWVEWYQDYSRHEREPALRVAPKGRKSLGWDFEPHFDEDYEPMSRWERLWKELQVPWKKDDEVTLGDIWAPKSRDNFTNGECSNEEIAIHLEYDLSSSWDVHVTIEADKDGHYMWKVNPPTNRPVITVATGGAPVEDARSDRGELDGKKKKVSNMLFLPDIFERFLKGEVGSEARKTEHAVYDMEEERARQQAAAEERERQRRERQQNQTNGPGDDGEEHHSDGDSYSDEEY
ncbi:hypothetical protein BD310DRAFT_871915 [Dichomitus squalens]|uniref:Uncharacterized protein n=1 Tax=Dichomitus squalens TaxID=114155 RepID=A0A4Q9Q4S4_9APHY|nr:hypothetical protein BD310DRAFT_871915 [Dichomitus squalens]